MTECVDYDESCDWWMRKGECHINQAWMHFYCRKSCTNCADDYTGDICEYLLYLAAQQLIILGRSQGIHSHLKSELSMSKSLGLAKIQLLPTAYVVRDGRLCFQSVHNGGGGSHGQGRYLPGLPPPPPTDRAADGVLDRPRSVCLLLSRRRTFLYSCETDTFSD